MVVPTALARPGGEKGVEFGISAEGGIWGEFQ